MISGKLSNRGQTTIPQQVRTALGLSPGDHVGYWIEGNRAVLTREPAELQEYPFRMFTEWYSAADKLAYAGL